MGKYENQLRTIADGANWEIDYLTGLKSLLVQLESDMAKLSKAPGWTGVSAEAASAKFTSLQGRYDDLTSKLTGAERALADANQAKARARTKCASLPDANVPSWVHTAAVIGVSVLIPVPGIGTFAAEMVVQKVNEFMGAQREAEAHKALQDLHAALEPPKRLLAGSRPPIPGLPEWPQESATPEWPGDGVTWHGDHTGSGAWSTNGGTTGVDGTSRVTYPKPPAVITIPTNEPPGWPVNTIGVDGDTSGGTSGGFGGGALGAGMLGVGGLAAASKLARGGGLLGAGGGGVGFAGGMGGGVGGGAGSGAAGGRSSSAMMGGGAPGGGGSEKEKRNGLGLIAPKLEDDDEPAPRSAAAGAGSRE